MKSQYLLFLISLSAVLWSCETPEPQADENTKTYNLFRAGYEPVSGDVTFTRLGEHQVGIRITLQNTDARFDFPAHLHFGTITEVGELAIRLQDVDGATGQSYTELNQIELSSGELFSFDMLETFNGSVKVHLAEGVLGQYVLSYGNIGANENYLSDGIAICTGH